MMHIEPYETEIFAESVFKDGRILPNPASQRILELTRSYLVELARDASGWETVYRDPADDRLWECDYPHSNRHGGGPPRLRNISLEEARQKYNLRQV